MSHVFVDWSIVMCLLILPTVFHVLINRRIACPNHIWSYDIFDDQTLGRSCVIFPGSHVVRSHDMLGTGRLRDESHDRSCDTFPQSCVLESTWLELGLGAVVKQLVIVEWVLGSFGNAFLVGTSFTCNSLDAVILPGEWDMAALHAGSRLALHCTTLFQTTHFLSATRWNTLSSHTDACH